MDIQAYIQNGIIESYVLGLADTEEVAEIEKLRLQYPEVEAAIEEFSVMLEEQALLNAIVPPPDVKSKVLAAIRHENEDESKDEEGEKNIIPVVPIAPNQEASATVHLIYFRKWRMVAAASIILLITSAALNLYFYNRYKQRDTAYQALLLQRNTLLADNQIYQTHLREWQTASEMMADPEMAMIKMPDVSGKSRHLATVFWNTRSKDVYVMPNTLPHPEAGKQYQLWALVNGKPVDAGMLDVNCTGVCKMKNTPNAQAFAITLENQGGSPTPTMTAMMVLGKV